MTKSKLSLIPYAMIGLLLSYFLNRFVGSYLMTQGATPERLSSSFNLFSEGLQTQPFSINLAPQALLACLFGLAIAGFAYLSRDTRNYRMGQEQGSARFGMKSEAKMFANKDFSKNIILAKGLYLNVEPNESKPLLVRNTNYFTIGGSGSWKTTSIIMTNLAQMNGSFVLTDPKGTTIRRMGKMLEKHGYKIKVTDFDTLQNSDHVNPFAYIHDEVTLIRTIQVLIHATNGEHAKRGEPFWDKSEEMLLTSLFAYQFYNYQGDGDIEGDGVLPKLADIPMLVRNLERPDKDIPSVLEILFDDFTRKFGRNNFASLQFDSFKNYQGQTRQSVVAIATSRFWMFDLPAVKEMTRNDTLEIDKWGDEKYAVFLKIPDMDRTFNFLTSLIFLLAFRTLEYKADQEYQGSLPVHVQFMLDEFLNLGLVPDIENATSVIRSRNMGAAFFVQTMFRFQKLYEKEWGSILGNCDSLIYLSGATEPETTKYFSKRSGKETITVRNQGRSRGRMAGSNLNWQNQGRDLMTESEVDNLNRLYSLVKISSIPIFKLPKYNYKKHPRAPEWSNSPSDGKWYYYRRYKDDIDMWRDNIRRENLTVETVNASVDEIERKKLYV